MQEMLPRVTTVKCYYIQGKITPVSEGTSKISTTCNPSNGNQFKAALIKHEAEENMVRSTVHNIIISIKHIILLLLERFYYYSLCIIFFPFHGSYCIKKKLSLSQALWWWHKWLCPISQRQSCEPSSAELQSIILSTGFLIKYYFFVYLYAKWI